jgi:hypothetical protein
MCPPTPAHRTLCEGRRRPVRSAAPREPVRSRGAQAQRARWRSSVPRQAARGSPWPVSRCGRAVSPRGGPYACLSATGRSSRSHPCRGELLGALIAGISQGVLDEQRIAVEAAIRLEFVNIKLVLALDRNKDPGPVSDGSRDTAARSPNRCGELWTPGLLSPPC